MKRYRVWPVDDREKNREDFRRRHSADFELEVFEKPKDVYQAILDGRRSDALLCDIFFIEDPTQREDLEMRVKRQAEELRKTLATPGLNQESGIQLIDDIRQRLGETPRFLIYAYTSKGPYLLQDEGFERLEKLDARWLFKGKYSAPAEYHRIITDIEAFKDRFNWPKRLWQIAIATGASSAVFGVLLDRAFQYIFGF